MRVANGIFTVWIDSRSFVKLEKCLPARDVFKFVYHCIPMQDKNCISSVLVATVFLTHVKIKERYLSAFSDFFFALARPFQARLNLSIYPQFLRLNVDLLVDIN